MTHFPARRFTRRPYAFAPVDSVPRRSVPFTTAQRLALSGLAGVGAALLFVAALCVLF